ncbi:MAG: GNAT family N-acetyltransferase [Pseudomonadales bacterium]|jgi:GNAT superfamily N-acetyltransferase|nr:GNAT family N-acetyltransferase [Pseudomonadales bacterium]
MMRLETLTPPAPITESHDLSRFCSGVLSLDEWLQKRALKNERASASRTYVTCDGAQVVGYYCLAAGAVALQEAPKKLARNMPNPIPVMVLGRLAIDQHYQNQGIGKTLLLDAVRRSVQAAQIAGVSALLVHALSDAAKRFYLAQGFSESPVQPMTLCLALGALKNLQ